HYRSPLNYSDAHLNDARNALERLYTVLKNHAPPYEQGEATVTIDWVNDIYAARFMAAMNDDFNTPEAIAVLFDLASEANRTSERRYAVLLKALGGILGLLQQPPQQYLQSSICRQSDQYSVEDIEHMIRQ